MRQLCTEKEARLTELKHELLRRISRFKFFDSRCYYTAPKAKMPVEMKKMMKSIDEIEKEIVNDLEKTKGKVKVLR